MATPTASAAQKERYDSERARLGKIFGAAAANDVSGLEEALAAGEKETVHLFKDANQRNVLHFAASLGHVEVCKAILSWLSEEGKKTAISAEDVNGDDCLRLAVRVGRLETSALLFKEAEALGLFKADEPESKEELASKPTLLHEAASSSNEEMVSLVLNEFGLKDRINVRAKVGTPLFWAAFNASESVARLLLEAGADVDARDSEGVSALFIAVANDAAEVAKVLTKAGAKLTVYEAKHGSTTVLHAGAASGAVSALKAVLENAPKDQIEEALAVVAVDMTPIDLAAFSGFREATKLFATYAGLTEAEQEEKFNKMLEIKAAQEEEATALVDETCTECDQLKNKGNQLFHAGDIDGAVQVYTQAIDKAQATLEVARQVKAKLCTVASSERVEKLESVILAVLLSNRSACILKRGTPEAMDSAAFDAQQAVEFRPKWPKGYYRLGMALEAKEMYAEAAQAYWSGYEVDSKDKGAPALMKLFQGAVKAGKAAEALRQQQQK